MAIAEREKKEQEKLKLAIDGRQPPSTASSLASTARFAAGIFAVVFAFANFPRDLVW